MSKNPIKVMSGMLTGRIYAGRVNAKGMFVGEKDDVTDTAWSAVAEHLIHKQEEIHFSARGKKYVLKVEELKDE
jgi:hypothetical protein